MDYLGEPIIIYQPSFNAHCRIDEAHANQILKAIGNIKENKEGQMVDSGILKDYYFQNLTFLNEKGNSVRNIHFFPDFITIHTLSGNVIPPKVEVSDYNPVLKDISKITIVGIPTHYRPTFINLLVDSL